VSRHSGVWVTPRLDLIQRPRVSWCAFTRKWIVNARGSRHVCGRGSFKSDQAFRRWHDAMAEANRAHRARYEALFVRR
jgi:hypothetical protein